MFAAGRPQGKRGEGRDALHLARPRAVAVLARGGGSARCEPRVARTCMSHWDFASVLLRLEKHESSYCCDTSWGCAHDPQRARGHQNESYTRPRLRTGVRRPACTLGSHTVPLLLLLLLGSSVGAVSCPAPGGAAHPEAIHHADHANRDEDDRNSHEDENHLRPQGQCKRAHCLRTRGSPNDAPRVRRRQGLKRAPHPGLVDDWFARWKRLLRDGAVCAQNDKRGARSKDQACSGSVTLGARASGTAAAREPVLVSLSPRALLGSLLSVFSSPSCDPGLPELLRSPAISPPAARLAAARCRALVAWRSARPRRETLGYSIVCAASTPQDVVQPDGDAAICAVPRSGGPLLGEHVREDAAMPKRSSCWAAATLLRSPAGAPAPMRGQGGALCALGESAGSPTR